MSDSWKEFWSTYRFSGTIREDLLYEQVGRTLNGRPIPAGELELSVRFIRESLAVDHEDVVLEFCCGNGIISYELAGSVKRVIAIDFSDHLIKAAQQFRQHPNVVYSVGDALLPLQEWLEEEAPRKFLMANALAYFDPAELDRILHNVTAVAPREGLRFLLTAIPDADRKWNFYDTPERRRRHEEHVASGGHTNDGVGRWWTEAEIHEVVRRHGLTASIVPEPGAMSHYRMAALVR
jgi:cyclopropane fatty-acyl-phospholipid synthase-like methyltransferase